MPPLMPPPPAGELAAAPAIVPTQVASVAWMAAAPLAHPPPAIERQRLGLAARGAQRDRDQFIVGIDRELAGVDHRRVADDRARVVLGRVHIHRHANGRAFLRAAAVIEALVLRGQETLRQILAIAQAALTVGLGVGLLQRLLAADRHRRQDDVADQIQALRGIFGVNGDVAGGGASNAGAPDRASFLLLAVALAQVLKQIGRAHV
ncbi:hypothetical protein G6F65_019681 [Rhizopus arrhizus]|nr:hypothetical protein G6F65_019681 [Rhizopus arrhizus]